MLARHWHSSCRLAVAVGGVGIALVFAAVPGVAQPATVILVRHAERAAAPVSDPVLTPEGEQRAKDLAAALAGARVTAVITTQLQRTKLTAQPVLDAIGTQPIVVPVASPVAVHVEAVAAAVRARPAGDVVLVVGHSNTIPGIVAALGGPAIPDFCDREYSNLLILEYSGAAAAPRLIRARFGMPDPAGADTCTRSMR